MILIALLLGMNSSAEAACSYRLSQDKVQVSDRTVYFGDFLNQKLLAKGYRPISDGQTPDYTVELMFSTEDRSHFQYALSKLTIKSASQDSAFSRSAEVRCYTQSCAAKDGAKVIRKSIDDFGKFLTICGAKKI